MGTNGLKIPKLKIHCVTSFRRLFLTKIFGYQNREEAVIYKFRHVILQKVKVKKYLLDQVVVTFIATLHVDRICKATSLLQ